MLSDGDRSSGEDDDEIAAISLRTRSRSRASTPRSGLGGAGGGRAGASRPANIFEVRAETASARADETSLAFTGRDDPVARSLLTALDAEESFEPIEDCFECANSKKRKKPPLGATPCRRHTKPRPGHAAADWPPGNVHEAPVARVPLTSLSVAFGSMGFNPPRPNVTRPSCAPPDDPAPPRPPRADAERS